MNNMKTMEVNGIKYIECRSQSDLDSCSAEDNVLIDFGMVDALISRVAKVLVKSCGKVVVCGTCGEVDVCGTCGDVFVGAGGRCGDVFVAVGVACGDVFVGDGVKRNPKRSKASKGKTG